MNRHLVLSVVFSLSALSTHVAHALGLVQALDATLRRDPLFASATANLDAAQQRILQNKGDRLPKINLEASVERTRSTQLIEDTANRVATQNFKTWSLKIEQALFNEANRFATSQAEAAAASLSAALSEAEQDLMMRVAQAYFDVVQAEDTLRHTISQRAAFTQQLERAQRSFEVGTVAINDTFDAQAKLHQSIAAENTARLTLSNKRSALSVLTGLTDTQVLRLADNVVFPTPEPSNASIWANLARQQAPSVSNAKSRLEAAKFSAKKIQAGHLPTLTASANSELTYQNRSLVGVDTIAGPGHISRHSMGLTFAVPIYSGGAQTARVQEALAAIEVEKNTLEKAKNTAYLTAEQAFSSTVSGLGQINALENAVVSSQMALEASILGIAVGQRIGLDALNATERLYQIQRDLSQARIETLLAQLRLKASIGILKRTDFTMVGTLLTDAPPPEATPLPQPPPLPLSNARPRRSKQDKKS